MNNHKELVNEEYSNISFLYDALFPFKNIESWQSRIEIFINNFGINKGSILDIGSGTCNFAKCWVEKNYNVICVDSSISMLQIGKNKIYKCNKCHFICGSYDCLKVQPIFDLITAVNDVFGYISYKDSPLLFLKFAKSMLGHKGLFVFDILTPGLRHSLNQKRIINLNDNAIVEINKKIINKNILKTEIVLHGIFKLYREEHFVELFSEKQIKTLLKKSGFQSYFIGDFTMSGLPPSKLPTLDVVAFK